MSLDTYLAELEYQMEKHEVGNYSETLSNGEFSFRINPSMAKIKEAVTDDYKSDPKGFPRRVINQVVTMVCSDVKYARTWEMAVLLTACDLLDKEDLGGG